MKRLPVICINLYLRRVTQPVHVRTSVVKKTVACYLCRGSHVFTFFVDFSNAFDKKLFRQMIDDGSDMCLVRLLAFWYSNKLLFV